MEGRTGTIEDDGGGGWIGPGVATGFTVVVIGVQIGVGWIGVGYRIDEIDGGGGGTGVMFDGNQCGEGG